MAIRIGIGSFLVTQRRGSGPVSGHDDDGAAASGEEGDLSCVGVEDADLIVAQLEDNEVAGQLDGISG